jgi:Tol biopolymer transport system component
MFGLLAVGIAIWKSLSLNHSPETVSILRTSQITTWTGLDLYPALSPDGNSIAYSSEHNGSFEIYVKPLTPGAREIQLTADGKENFEPTWSPDGKLIAYYSKNRGGIWVVPATGGMARQLTEFGSHPAWSPDGSLIAFQSYTLTDLSATSIGALSPSTLWTVQAQGGEPRQITQLGMPHGGHGCASWSPDSKRLVFITCESLTPELWSVGVTGEDLKLITRSQKWAYDPVYSPDGKCIYYGGTSAQGNFVLNRICVSPVSGASVGEPIEIANTGLARIKHLSISADGKKLAYSAPTMKGSVLSVPVSPTSNEATGIPVRLTEDTSYRKGMPTISPDGRKIAYVEFRGGINQDIWSMDIDGKNASQLTTNPATEWAPSWLPDSQQIAYQSNRQGNPTLWASSIQSGREKLLVDTQQDMGWPKLSPDGKTFAFNSTKSGTTNIWKVDVEGGEPQQLTFDAEQAGWPYWSPDGKFLAFQRRQGDDTHICVMPSSGGEATQLTFDHGQSWTGGWAPDGDKIAFAGWRNGYWNLWWVSRSTKQQKQLTNFTKLNAYVRYPSWSPLGNQIVFEYSETTGNIWLMELK